MKRRPLPGLLALSLLLFIAACRTTTRPEPPVSQTQTSAPANDPSVAPEPDTIARIVNPPVVHEAAAREPQPVAERREVEAGRALAAKKAASVAYDMAAGAAAYPAAPACSYNMMAFGSGGAPQPAFNTEDYKAINDNVFHAVKDAPLSTFSVDVDAASYSNLRRFIQQNQRPPKDAVRIEEMVNYFSYDYPEPTDNRPFSITTDVAACPWAEGHRLVHIGLKGRSMDAAHQPPCNLVFLIDVSGSMDEPNKLPLVKSAFRLLTQQLRAKDRVAIVVYAGNAGVVLPSTRGSEKQKILDALDRLEAGGSTAGGEGIQLAYKIARENFLREGNNRVILATDGDFNVGVSSDGELLRLIEKERRSGVFLTALGFGMGNYKDSKMQTLADAGNGNYAYIDTALEAKRVLVFQMGATLFTIAKDVKIQVEFNPARVASYRLIGYEKRLLNDEDFNNDAKDAGEIGAGHTVTALYEVVPAGLGEWKSGVDPLKYQTRTPVDTADRSGELLTVKFRYKAPQGEKSHLITTVLKDEGARPIQRASENLRFAASVAAFGMILRESPFIGKFSYDDAANLAAGALGDDPDGYRAEFVRLVKAARGLDEQKS